MTSGVHSQKPHSSKPSKPICLARTTSLKVFVLLLTLMGDKKQHKRYNVLLHVYQLQCVYDEYLLARVFADLRQTPRLCFHVTSGFHSQKPHLSKPSKPICLARTTSLKVFVLFATPVAG